MPTAFINLDWCDRSGYFWIKAKPLSLYFSFVLLIISSKVEPLKPREFQVAIQISNLNTFIDYLNKSSFILLNNFGYSATTSLPLKPFATPSHVGNTTRLACNN